MSKILRKFQKIFATNSADNGQFGSAQLGTKLNTNDLDTIQALSAYNEGWVDATVGGDRLPAQEEMQALHFMTTTQIAYLMQEGIAEYDASTTYFQKSIVKKTGTYEIWGSLTNDNTGNALAAGVDWEFLQDLGGSNALNGPTGGMIPYGGDSAPSGWLLCFGQEVSRATYATLFGVVGTKYGIGDGSLTFNVPDRRGRGSIGLDNMGGVSANRVVSPQADIVGGTGGAEGATNPTNGHALTSSQITHKHETTVVGAAQISKTANFGTGTTILTTANEGGANTSSGNARLTNNPSNVSTSTHSHTIAQENNMDPYMADNWIIKT